MYDFLTFSTKDRSLVVKAAIRGRVVEYWMHCTGNVYTCSHFGPTSEKRFIAHVMAGVDFDAWDDASREYLIKRQNELYAG